MLGTSIHPDLLCDSIRRPGELVERDDSVYKESESPAVAERSFEGPVIVEGQSA